MADIILKNKPLVEAIFEMKWYPKKGGPHPTYNPNYELIIGRMYDRLIEEYPFHEPLPQSQIPDQLIYGVVQHRFRKAKNDWPLVQIGPGIVTVNDTHGYIWDSFRDNTCKAIDSFYNAYPEPKEINVNSIMLRYIDGMEFNYDNDNIFEFLKNNLKIDVNLYPPLFKDTCVNPNPFNFDLNMSFNCEKPLSLISIRFAKAIRNDKSPGIIWETIVHSTDENIPTLPDDLEGWLEQSHEITHDWFFKLIEGELLRRFE